MSSSVGRCASRQRQVILEELRKLTSHPTADELYEIVRLVVPRISLGTVYRNLDVLSEAGLVRVLHAGGEPKRFDGNPDGHWHIRCSRCGKIGDMPAAESLDLAELVQGSTGYEVTGWRVDFAGICPECAGTQR